MSNEFTFLFHNAYEGLIAGGMPATEAEELLSDLIAEASFCEEETVPHISISDCEYDLSRMIISYLTEGGLGFNRAVFLTASFMAAVEDRVGKGLRN